MSDKRKRKPLEPDEDRVDATGVPTTRNEHRVLYLKPCPTKFIYQDMVPFRREIPECIPDSKMFIILRQSINIALRSMG